MSIRRRVFIVVVIAGLVFLGWRLLRPINIYVVSPAFERPVDTTVVPAGFNTLSAEECRTCHQTIYEEWATTIHAHAWTDPYFQVDWKFDGSPQNCKNCHIPLDRQQEHKVMGFNDVEKWDPILAPNPQFDAALQHEGVTCNGCHLREGKIIGLRGDTDAPHETTKIDTGNRICVQCHVVSGKRWDTFFDIPPCGTVAEINTAKGKSYAEESRDMSAADIASLGCVQCHMPVVERSLVAGGDLRTSRRHLWRGGHDPAMVKQGLSVAFEEVQGAAGKRQFRLILANSGADHALPTGTPDRHLTVALRQLDAQGKLLDEQQHILKRTIMWRPFIVDLWDTRLAPKETREFTVAVAQDQGGFVEAEVRYHLLDEARRKRIGYENKEPIHYQVFSKKMELK